MTTGEVIALIKAFGGSGGGGGGGSSVLVVNATWSGTTLTCDKTASEMLSAVESGGCVVHYLDSEGNEYFYMVFAVVHRNPDDDYIFITPDFSMHAATLSDYPSNDIG